MDELTVELERKKLRSQMAIEMNKAAVEYSQKALRGVFLLNGGAVTAITVLQMKSLMMALCWYGIGAALAVLGTFFSYMSTAECAGTWGDFIDMEPYSWTWFKRWKTCGAAAGLASGTVFVVTTLTIMIL